MRSPATQAAAGRSSAGASSLASVTWWTGNRHRWRHRSRRSPRSVRRSPPDRVDVVRRVRRQVGRRAAQGPRRRLPGRRPTRRCSSGSPRSTTPRSIGSPTTSPSCRPPTSSHRSSTIRPTSARSPRPTRAATCSRWAGGWWWRSTSPPSRSTSRARRSRRSSKRPRRWSPRRAARSPAATRSATPSRSSDSPCRASCTPTGSSARWGARPGDVLVLSKPIGTGLALADGTDADKAVAIAGMRRLNRAARETLAVVRRRGARRHRRDRVRARRSRVGDGRAVRCGWSSTRRASSPTRAPPGGRRAASAPAATSATVTTWRATSTRPRRAGPEALCFDPQTSGGLLAAVDPDVWRRCWSPTARPIGRADGDGGASARSRAGAPRLVLQVASPAMTARGRPPTQAGSSGSCGTRATTSSSASTRSAVARGPVR